MRKCITTASCVHLSIKADLMYSASSYSHTFICPPMVLTLLLCLFIFLLSFCCKCHVVLPICVPCVLLCFSRSGLTHGPFWLPPCFVLSYSFLVFCTSLSLSAPYSYHCHLDQHSPVRCYHVITAAASSAFPLIPSMLIWETLCSA